MKEDYNIYVTVIASYIQQLNKNKYQCNKNITFFSISGAHTTGCEIDNNTMISFSNFKNDGNVKSFEGQDYIVTEDIDTDEKYKDSEAQFHSLYNHWSLTGAYIDMKEFLNNEKRLIMQEKRERINKASKSKTSLFLHDLPLQGNFI